MSHFKSSVTEDLITLTVIPIINGKTEPMAIQYDRTTDMTVEEIVAQLSVTYHVNPSTIQMRIPDAEDSPMYLVQHTTKISMIRDSSTLYAIIKTE